MQNWKSPPYTPYPHCGTYNLHLCFMVNERSVSTENGLEVWGFHLRYWNSITPRRRPG